MTERRRAPERTCLGCRQVKGQDQLLRFVCSPDGAVLADLKGRLPGRGAYLCIDRRCVTAAVKKKQFDRAFRRSCLPITDESLAECIAGELMTRLAGLLGMARKSAMFVAGSNAVLDALARNKSLAVIVLARDISPQIGEKIRHRAASHKIMTTVLFDKIELGRIFGRAERSVVGLPEGKLAEAFLADLHRYLDISGEG